MCRVKRQFEVSRGRMDHGARRHIPILLGVNHSHRSGPAIKPQRENRGHDDVHRLLVFHARLLHILRLLHNLRARARLHLWSHGFLLFISRSTAQHCRDRVVL